MSPCCRYLCCLLLALLLSAVCIGAIASVWGKPCCSAEDVRPLCVLCVGEILASPEGKRRSPQVSRTQPKKNEGTRGQGDKIGKGAGGGRGDRLWWAIAHSLPSKVTRCSVKFPQCRQYGIWVLARQSLISFILLLLALIL